MKGNLSIIGVLFSLHLSLVFADEVAKVRQVLRRTFLMSSQKILIINRLDRLGVRLDRLWNQLDRLVNQLGIL